MSASASQYAALITSEHRPEPKFSAWVEANAQPFVDLQNQMQSLQWLLDLDKAAGDQLDKLGKWVGVSRKLSAAVNGVTVLDDASYRVLLKLFVAMNAWDGTVPGIYAVWETVFSQEQYQILVSDNLDMTMDVIFLNPPTDLLILAILTQGYFLLRPAGVKIDGYWEPSAPYPQTPIMGLDVEDASIKGLDEGALVEPI